MTAGRRALLAALAAAALLPAAAAPAAAEARHRAPRQTLFIGIDTSGSFARAGHEDALAFAAHYIHGHLNGLGGLSRPRDLFVAGIGGSQPDEAKAFHPIHDFAGKGVAEIEAALRERFPPSDALTDFNAFFRRVARIVVERNLLFAPINVVLFTDGIPDLAAAGEEAYAEIDLTPLDYLARSVTVRLAYTSPVVGDRWRTMVRRQRVRLWTVDHEVMKGWRAQLRPDAAPAEQDRLWQWVRANVDFRVRRGL